MSFAGKPLGFSGRQKPSGAPFHEVRKLSATSSSGIDLTVRGVAEHALNPVGVAEAWNLTQASICVTQRLAGVSVDREEHDIEHAENGIAGSGSFRRSSKEIRVSG